MRRTSPTILLLITLAAAVAVTFAMQFGNALRYSLAITTWIEPVAIAVLGGMILWLGNGVRQYQKGNKPNLDGVRAARTLALAKAGSLTGAVLLGRYGAVAMVIFTDPITRFGVGGLARRIVINAAIAALVSLALIVASLVAEKWCELPPSKPELRNSGHRAMLLNR